MQNLVLSPIDPEVLINEIANKVVEKLQKAQSQPEPEPANDNPIDDYIPKHEVRGKLASASTLWSWEKQGKLKSYGVGKKRFYKRSDIENLFKEH